MSESSQPAQVGSNAWLGQWHEAERLAREIEAYGADLRHCRAWAAELRRQHAEIVLLKKLYEELLFAVGNKHVGETRHQTALRYIQQAEASADDGSKCNGPNAELSGGR